MLVSGFALRLLPRFFGSGPFHGLLPAAVLIPIAVSAALRTAAASLPGAALAAALLTAAGGLVFAGGVAAVLRRSERRIDGLLFALAALWLPGAGALELADARAAALDAVLWGCAGGHIVAVYARTAPAFIAARPPGRLAAGLVGVLWHAGIAAAAAGALEGWIATLAGALVLIGSTRLYGRGIALRTIPPGARVTRTALRFAFAWLVVALALLSIRGIEGWFGPLAVVDTSAARHAFTLGFLLPVIYAYGVRLVPFMVGGPPPVLRAVFAIVVLANLGALIRVLADGTTRDPVVSTLVVLLSGAFAGAALMLFIALAVRSARRGGLPLA